MTRRYGWRPDLPDHRDHIYLANQRGSAQLPPIVDLRSSCPPVLDQGELGSCTAHALAQAHLYCQMREAGGYDSLPSRLWIYYQERAKEGTIESDSGAQIRDGIKVLAAMGAPPEDLWPYEPARFSQEPPQTAQEAASAHQVTSYSRVDQTLFHLRHCLSVGFPFVFGFTVYPSFETDAVAQTGIVPMPGKGESPLGGHAVMAAGYNDSKRHFLVMNSWGSSWGQGGFFELPYDYLLNPQLADDFWTIRIVEELP
jgi:C1A family cysteine protease